MPWFSILLAQPSFFPQDRRPYERREEAHLLHSMTPVTGYGIKYRLSCQPFGFNSPIVLAALFPAHGIPYSASQFTFSRCPILSCRANGSALTVPSDPSLIPHLLLFPNPIPGPTPYTFCPVDTATWQLASLPCPSILNSARLRPQSNTRRPLVWSVVRTSWC